MLTPKDIFEKNRRDALDLATKIGNQRTREHLKRAEQDLIVRLGGIAPNSAPFTTERMRATLIQVRQVLRQLQPGMQRAIVETGEETADSAAGGSVEYMNRLEQQFKGVGTQPLAIDEAAVLDVAREGARSSILRRLMSSGTTAPGADAQAHPAKVGILDRYGANVIGFFERELQTSLLARRSFEDTRTAIVAQSPFLQGAPASWSERIVRTETMGAYSRANFEAHRELDEQLGDAVKILAATFDDRTGSDSIAVHGQIRRTAEAFETWFGLMQHPPNRPNDREIVVPHRISWPLPPYLAPMSRSEVVARWTKEKRKGKTPPTPQNTTVARSSFGQSST